ncbi:MAG: polysaccharide biosynthesis C-terminal domain-containing protein [Clostridia bacterium]|nr:polysaccharide biosynthesis C-terminal domain-containing protein [Clostridia bacterium]
MVGKINKKALIYTIGNVAYLFALWLLTVLTTRFSGYESAGVLTLAMSLGNICTFLQMYGMRNYQASDVSRQFASGDYLRSRFFTSAASIILLAIILLFGRYPFKTSVSIILYTLFRFFEAISDVFHGEMHRADKLDKIGVLMFARGAITVILFLTGEAIFRSLNASLLTVAVGSAAITFTLDLPVYRKVVEMKSGSRSGVKKLLTSCFPLLIAFLLPTLITAFPRILLEKFKGAETLGYYGNVSTPAVIITAVVPNIIASYMPRYGELTKEGKNKETRRLWLRTLLLTLMILAVCSAGVALIGKPVLSLIYTESIVPYIKYLYFFLISTALYAATMCGAAVLTARRKNVIVCVCASIAAVVCIVSSFPLVKYFGIPGAIAAMIVSYSVQAVIQLLFILKYTGIPHFKGALKETEKKDSIS